jgi:hypothetical protein
MTGGWGFAALMVIAVTGTVRASFALRRHRRWLDTVDQLAGMVPPSHRVTCRDADGAVVEIVPGAGPVNADPPRRPGCASWR